MGCPNQSIELRLNSAGYKGEEINELLPDFITERNTTVGLTWFPSVYGPENLTLVITVSIIVAEFAKGFVTELSKDLYRWSKSKILPLLKRKRSPYGQIVIQLLDASIYYDQGRLQEPSRADKFAEFLNELPAIVTRVDSSLTKEWEAQFDESTATWTVKPVTPVKE